MNQSLPTEKVDLYRWTTIVVTLSLDLANPYFPHMGLHLPDGLQQGVRGIIEELRRQKMDPELSSAYASGILDWSTQRFGEQFQQRLYTWGTEIFNYGLDDDAGAALFLWSNLVNHRGYPGAPVIVAPPFVLRLRAVLAATAPPSVHRYGPETVWDKSMYAWREYDEDIYTPMTSVSLTLGDYQFRRAWAAVREEMGDHAGLDAVKSWGLDLARQMNMPVDRLGDPGEWRELPLLS